MDINLKRQNIPFSPPDISEVEIAEVTEVLRLGWITAEIKAKLLKRRLTAFIETEKADIDCNEPEAFKKYSNRVVYLNFGTAVEELNLRILGIGPGDEVIVSTHTYSAMASAAINCGATVFFVDIQKDDNPLTHMLKMDYEKLKEVIAPKTKAIVAVDLGEIFCDYSKIFQTVEEKRHLFSHLDNDSDPLLTLSSRIQHSLDRVAVVANSAHALGASFKINEKIYNYGNITEFISFSFYKDNIRKFCAEFAGIKNKNKIARIYFYIKFNIFRNKNNLWALIWC